MVRESASVRVYTDIELLSEELEVIQTNLDKQGTTLWDFKSTLDYYEGTSELGHKVLDRMLTQLQRQGEDFRELQRQADLARHRVCTDTPTSCRLRSILKHVHYPTLHSSSKTF